MDCKLFPFDTIRDSQRQFVQDVQEALNEGTSLVAHAPTGLGKTAATLAPALEFAMERKKVIFFLTSRHTQHAIAVDTLQAIRKKHGVKFHCADLIGKKHMCLVPGVTKLYAGDFFDYCKRVREENSCEFYTNTRENTAFTVKARALVQNLKHSGPLHVNDIKEQSNSCRMCPHEIGIGLAKDAQVIIADYFYVFNPTIFNGFLSKINKSVDDCIIIVDEGHNVPDRMRDLMTSRLTINVLTRAIKEASKFNYPELGSQLVEIRDILRSMAKDVQGQKRVKRASFEAEVKKKFDYEELEIQLSLAADQVRMEAKASFMGSVAQFLNAWQQDDHGFVRYVEVEREKGKDDKVSLFYKCLDPSILTKEVIDHAHSTIMMSGTLSPVDMYRDLMGFPESTPCQVYESPFPKENRLNLVIPQTSTRYATRGQEQYKNIAKIVAEIINNVPGNVATFFPSYYLRDHVYKELSPLCTKTTFMESPGLTTMEKHELLERFKSYYKSGAALLGVASGSFGEGIDLPGDYLKAVIVVGLPLKQPNEETKALIEYYDTLFGKGWDYGYTFPSINSVMQAAGRCIRTKDDKGVIIFLDERYAWQNYMRCFPADWDMKVTGLYKARILEFFEQTEKAHVTQVQ